jgi:preprotein translocase subunit SecA
LEYLEANPEVAAAYSAAKARYAELKAKFDVDCKVEGDKVRALGGLYVLGTERHESRRIDNQLRGRSGRQGDNGESRFYLSLEDELMRIFATGTMNWVMGKALPDDVPIEAKMVTKAIERAQNTVEQRNAEIRKDVLKYDEVMNEQRKVIYALRDQNLTGGDLRSRLFESLHESANAVVTNRCEGDRSEWDWEGMHADLQSLYPTKFSVEDLQLASNRVQLVESIVAEATEHYEAKEEANTPEVMREVERNIFLSLIDARWRDHLAAMDYLKEGIHLQSLGQKDPLVEWQREGFEMFGNLMHVLDSEFVQYAMHAEVVVEGPAGPDLQNVQLSGPDDATIGAGIGLAAGTDLTDLFGDGAAVPSALAASAPSASRSSSTSAGNDPGLVQRAEEVAPAQPQTIVKSDQEKLGRNDPCWCGSGKKFKQCHGKAS